MAPWLCRRLWWGGAAPHAAGTAGSPQRPVRTGAPGATPVASRSERHRARHTQTHVFSHSSCSEDLKRTAGSWDRASLAKGKKEKRTGETALPCNRLCGFSAGKGARHPPGGVLLRSRSCVAWGSPRSTAAGSARCCGSQGVPGLPPHPSQRSCPRNHRKAVGRGSTTPEHRLGHRNRESKCL